MAQSKAGEFETNLNRLEDIVKKLEGEDITLDESVKLFREGKELARRCETLLKAAQDSIEVASRSDGNGAAVPSETLDAKTGDEELPF
jgi:exodeoxyribonuclease VII small subunit